MSFNQTDIGLLLFLTSGLIIMLLLTIIALPTILSDRIKKEAEKLVKERSTSSAGAQ